MPRCSARPTASASPGGADPFEDGAGDLGRDDRLAGRDRTHGGDQVAGARAFEQEPPRPGGDGVQDVGVVVEGGDDDGGRGGGYAAILLGRAIRFAVLALPAAIA